MKFMLMFFCLASFTSVSQANLDSVMHFLDGVGRLYRNNFGRDDVLSQTWTQALAIWPFHVKDTRAKLDSFDGMFAVLSLCAGIPSSRSDQFKQNMVSNGCDYFRRAETSEFKPISRFGLQSNVMEFLYKMGEYYVQHKNENFFRLYFLHYIPKIFPQYVTSIETVKKSCDMVLSNEKALGGHQHTSPLVWGCKGLALPTIPEAAGGSEAESSVSKH